MRLGGGASVTRGTRGTPVRTRLGIPTILPDPGYPIDSEMGMGPDSGPWDFGSRSRTLSLVGTGYFLPAGQNFNGVVTTKLLALFLALGGASRRLSFPSSDAQGGMIKYLP